MDFLILDLIHILGGRLSNIFHIEDWLSMYLLIMATSGIVRCMHVSLYNVQNVDVDVI